MLKHIMQGIEFSIAALKEKLSLYQMLFPQVSKLFRLLLTMPATSATSKRSFSALRHIKTYLLTTMKQERLNHLMIIHIHKDRLIDFKSAIQEFIHTKENRINTFGHFKYNISLFL